MGCFESKDGEESGPASSATAGSFTAAGPTAEPSTAVLPAESGWRYPEDEPTTYSQSLDSGRGRDPEKVFPPDTEEVLVSPGDLAPPFGKTLRVMVNSVEIWQVPLRPGYERYFETTHVPIYAGRHQVGEEVVHVARYRPTS